MYIFFLYHRRVRVTCPALLGRSLFTDPPSAGSRHLPCFLTDLTCSHWTRLVFCLLSLSTTGPRGEQHRTRSNLLALQPSPTSGGPVHPWPDCLCVERTVVRRSGPLRMAGAPTLKPSCSFPGLTITRVVAADATPAPFPAPCHGMTGHSSAWGVILPMGLSASSLAFPVYPPLCSH